MENTYQNPPANKTPQEKAFKVRYVKERAIHPQKTSPAKVVVAILALVGFFVLGLIGVLISQRQYVSQEPVAPNVPQSQPAAFIRESSCTLTFTVPEVTPTPEPNECGYSPCDTDNDCVDDLICVTADDGEGYCAVEEYAEACAEDPSEQTCCEEPEPTPTPTPTPTPEILECGERGCDDNFDCEQGMICITADNGNNYCADPDYRSACADNPSEQNCCEEPEPTPTPTPTPSSTPSPSPSTTVTTTVTGGQPDFPEELPVSGPEDWLQYLQIGLGALGIGALLFLML